MKEMAYLLFIVLNEVALAVLCLYVFRNNERLPKIIKKCLFTCCAIVATLCLAVLFFSRFRNFISPIFIELTGGGGGSLYFARSSLLFYAFMPCISAQKQRCKISVF
jgi:hypothetical protein